METVQIMLKLLDFNTVLYWDGLAFALYPHELPPDNIPFENAKYAALNQFNDQSFEITVIYWHPDLGTTYGQQYFHKAFSPF